MNRLVVLCAAIIAFASCTQGNKPFFVQISDPQLGFMNGSADCSPELELLEKAIVKVNNLNPEFVVFTGDLVHWRNDTLALAAFDSLCTFIDKDITVYYLPGNHDVGNDAKGWEVEAFVKRYGHDRFVHKTADYTVIGFNTSVIKAQTEAEPAEYAWLEEQLKGADPKKPIILAAHFPIFTVVPDEPETYENLPLPMREKYMALFEKYGVDTYLAGHQHKCMGAQHNGIDYVIASALGRQLGSDTHGYTIVTVEDGKVAGRYVTVEEMENK